MFCSLRCWKRGRGFKIVGVIIEWVIVHMMDFIPIRYFAINSRINHPMKEDGATFRFPSGVANVIAAFKPKENVADNHARIERPKQSRVQNSSQGYSSPALTRPRLVKNRCSGVHRTPFTITHSRVILTIPDRKIWRDPLGVKTSSCTRISWTFRQPCDVNICVPAARHQSCSGPRPIPRASSFFS